jgi:hypothetical protein
MPTGVETADGLVRIRVPLERPAGEPGPEEDLIWAEALGSGRYRVETSPFFAYGISRDDVVQAADGAGQGDPLRLDAVVEKCGHRTLRVALDASGELAAPGLQALLQRLIDLGCTHELLRPRLVAIDLAPEVDLAAVTELLQARVQEGVLAWEWADPRPS